MEKIRVLHILWAGRSGGAERFVRDLVAYSDNVKFEHVVCFLSSGGIIADQIKQIGGKVFILGMKSGFDIFVGPKFIKLLKDVDAHVVNVHTRTYFINVLLCVFGCRARRIYFEHGGNLIGDHPEKEAFFYKLFGASFKVILANSEYVRTQIFKVSRLPEGKVRTFYIGIDLVSYVVAADKNKTKNEFGIPLANKVVGTVGRLVTAKGMDDFIKAAVGIKKKINDVSFVIVGAGEKREDLEELAESLGVNIIFLGERCDVPKLLKMFDVFLFTSKWEPFGIVILEAMAAKIPIAGFPVLGAKEIFNKGGLEGLLTASRDIEQLAILACGLLSGTEDGILRLKDKEFRNIEDNFNIKKAVEIIQKEYTAVLN